LEKKKDKVASHTQVAMDLPFFVKFPEMTKTGDNIIRHGTYNQSEEHHSTSGGTHGSI
jgi:hypothetical protein